MVLAQCCVFCGTEVSIFVPDEGYERWCSGTMIQHALPTLSSDDREFLISKTCPKCFDEAFGDDE
jgi:hypothetical protein